MKKKILSLAIVIALLAIMVGSTLAYFSAEDEVTNTFTVGSVKIEIYENGAAVESDVKEFDKPLVPVVNTQDPSKDESYQIKAVEVKNTGNNAAYIRTHIAIPTELVGYLYLDLDETGWTRQADSIITYTGDGKSYTVFTYDYNEAVLPGHYTSKLLKGAYLGSNVDLKEQEDGDLELVIRTNGQITDESNFVAHSKGTNGYSSAKVNILVASQAIQAQGFENGATDALNTGFAANPWASVAP